jgi:8-oxo-dGTP diphosphatase
MEIKQFMAMKGLINFNGKILLIRESGVYADGTNRNKFGVPGGRMQNGERFDDCLKREIEEETGLVVKIGKPFFVSEWRPVVRGEQWQITAVFFECFSETDDIKLSSDHDDYKWINPLDYKNIEIINNEHPVFDAYLNFLKK